MEEMFMKRNIVKSAVAICSLLLIGAMSSLGFVNHFSNNEIKEVKAYDDAYITFSSNNVHGKVGETSSYITATLKGYGETCQAYVSIDNAGTSIASIPYDNCSNNIATFNIKFLKAGVTKVYIMFANGNTEIVTESLDIYSESEGDYAISRFIDNGYHSLYFGDKGYLEFTPRSGFAKVTNASTSNPRCAIDSVEEGEGGSYKINFTTRDYSPDYEYGTEWDQPGPCFLTINCENESDSEQTFDAFIYLNIDVFDYYSPLFIAWEFATAAGARCAESLYNKQQNWGFVNKYYFDGYDHGDAAITIVNNVRYEMPDRNTVVKLNDNNIPYSIVHGVSQYDYMVETYGFNPHPQITRDTSAARISSNKIVEQVNLRESNNVLILSSLIVVASLGIIAFALVKKRKSN